MWHLQMKLVFVLKLWLDYFEVTCKFKLSNAIPNLILAFSFN